MTTLFPAPTCGVGERRATIARFSLLREVFSARDSELQIGPHSVPPRGSDARRLASCAAGALFSFWLSQGPFVDAAELPAPPSLRITLTNGVERLQVTPYPSAESYQVQSSHELGTGFANEPGGLAGDFTWNGPAGEQSGFHRVKVTPLSPDALLTSIVLNRLAYGPTPDELERILTGANPIGPAAYITEQLAPELIPDRMDAQVNPDEWRFVSVTGAASSSVLYLYLASPGEAYVDDLSLVQGDSPGVGQNLVKGGDFEAPLPGAWTVSTNLTASETTSLVRHAGSRSLRMVASSSGSTRASSIWQTLTPVLTNGQIYTLSYWYRPSTNDNSLTARLSGSGGSARPIDTTHTLLPVEYLPGTLQARLSNSTATVDDLRAWYGLHAVRSPRQLFEVLTQFIDNHFTTQYTKTRDYVAGQLTNAVSPRFLAPELKFRELQTWRQALLSPGCTFYDLLRISAESPLMIIYLDTVTSSRGSANENFSRELLELFTMGVDNGYDQGDIEEMSRAWTGWRVDKLPLGQEANPFATPVGNKDNDPGVWALRFRSDRHDTNAKSIFTGKSVDPRFGPGQAGRSYELHLPARAGNDGMKDGYDILAHLAALPFTQEYVSVKLCRLFVHEDFHHGIYDYSDPEHLSPEGKLIQACMTAWDTPAADGRKGNLRQVLRVIFDSELFRQQTAAQQKVKTPFEFVVSAIRSLRAAKPGGGYTAETDGYDMLTTLSRLNMKIFDRADPDGWSEFGRDWVSTAGLVERMRYAQNLLIAPNDALKLVDFGSAGNDNVSDPVALLHLKLPAAAWRDASAVTDYLLRILFPGEGAANLESDRARAIAFLNSNDTGTTDTSPFAALDPASITYDGRVRGLSAMLLGLPRFQEQ